MNVEFKLPALGENVEDGDIVNVLVHEGEQIAANHPVFELETDKAVVEIPCPHSGKIAKIHVGKGDPVKVGQTLLTLEAEAAEEQTVAPAGVETPADKPPVARAAGPPAAGQLPAGPAARRLARELGVDLLQVAGSGRQGRITPEDVQAAAAGRLADKPGVPPGPAPAAVVPPGEPGEDAWGPVRRERISKIRRTIAEQMVRSTGTIPHVTNFDDADVTELEHLRKGVPPGYLGEDLKLTMMPLVIKAVALALRGHPVLNASLDEENQQIIYKQYVNIGVAVDTPRGLVVPALRHCDRMAIPEIARELKTLAERRSLPWRTSAAARSRSATWARSAAATARRSSTIPRWPSSCWVARDGSRWSATGRSRRG